MKPVGPSPLPEHLYASRSLPVGTVASFAARIALWAVLIACIGAVFLFALSRSPSGEPVRHVLSQAFPLPIANVGDQTIYYRDFQTELDGWIRFYETAGALDVVDAKRLHDRVLDRRIDQEIVRQLAVELGRKDIAEEAEVLYQSMAADRGSEAKLIEDIDQRFGWTKNVFMAVIVEPIVYARRVDEAVKQNEDWQSAVKASAEQARLDFVAGTDAFTQTGDQGSKNRGLLTLDAYPAEVHDALRETVVGSVTDVLETRERFMVFKVRERDERESGIRVRTNEFSIDKRDVYDAIAQRRATLTIKIFER